MAKSLVPDLILAFLAQIRAQKIFSWVLILLEAGHCYKLSLYAILRKINEPNLRKWQKS